jgi:hypothetical protein
MVKDLFISGICLAILFDSICGFIDVQQSEGSEIHFCNFNATLPFMLILMALVTACLPLFFCSLINSFGAKMQ